MTANSDMGFSTTAIHSHQEPDPVTGSVVPPIYQTSTFIQEHIDSPSPYFYTRMGNPNMTALEGCLADLEQGAHALSFTSGLGALSTVALALFRPGDHVLCCEDIYGGSQGVFSKVLTPMGVTFEYADATNIETFRKAIKPNTKALYLETPSNPQLKLIDLQAMVALAKEHKLITIVDNTFATPYLQRPLTMGVDIVMHSITKYIGGHSDIVGGALIVKDDTYIDVLRAHQALVGATPDPFACWLTLRGIKTLAVRMEAHQKNAQILAEYLQSHPAVTEVMYPGLPTHPQYELAKRQMRGPGGMISIRIKGGAEETRLFLKALKLFGLAVSLGGVESLACYPAGMTHAKMDPNYRKQVGVTDDLIRLSIGIEDVADLKADIHQALQIAVEAAPVR